MKRLKITNLTLTLCVAVLLIQIPAISLAQYHTSVKVHIVPSEQVIEQKVNDLLNKLTLKEKLDLLGGTGFGTKPIPRLGIPPLNMSDGPLGVRWGKSTAFPSGTSMASSWDTHLLYEIGAVIGRELHGHGRDIILGPNVNIARNPLNGRTFEAFGEDPYLTSQMAVGYIKGVQSERSAATVKHFVANTQEYERHTVDEQVDHRTLREIYFPAFKAAVQKADVLAIMASYNKLNGTYATANKYILSDVLIHDWGFKNLDMSDWGAVYNTLHAENNGLDLEMPTGQFLNPNTLMPLIKSGQVKVSTVNDQVRRILRVIVSLGLMKNPIKPDSSLVDTPQNRKVALQAAKEGIVLLKNSDGLLPLDLSKYHHIAVIGPAAERALIGGGGSSMVTPTFSVTPMEALKKKIGNESKIEYAPGVMLDSFTPPIGGSQLRSGNNWTQRGLKAEFFNNSDFSGTPVLTRTDSLIDYGFGMDFFGTDMHAVTGLPDSLFSHGFSMRFTGMVQVPESGDYVLDVVTNNIEQFYFDGKEVAQSTRGYGIGVNTYKVHMVVGKLYPIRLDYRQNGSGVNIRLAMRHTNGYLIAKAKKLAEKADLALVMVGDSKYIESEGHDRVSLDLPAQQDSLVREIASVNKKTVVVVSAGAPVSMKGWHSKVGSIVDAWFGGEYTGTAVVDALTGEFDPAGHLPITFPVKFSDSPASLSYMKVKNVNKHDEGILVGYRYFDAKGIKPLFPFGYGLSYTHFGLSDLSVKQSGSNENPTVKVTFKITNEGKMKGSEVAQVYVHKLNTHIERAPKELKGFSRVTLDPGESGTQTVTLGKSAFSYYDVKSHAWKIEPGRYEIIVGRSSADAALTGYVNL